MGNVFSELATMLTSSAMALQDAILARQTQQLDTAARIAAANADLDAKYQIERDARARFRAAGDALNALSLDLEDEGIEVAKYYPAPALPAPVESAQPPVEAPPPETPPIGFVTEGAVG